VFAEAQKRKHQRVHEETLQGVQKLKNPSRIQRQNLRRNNVSYAGEAQSLRVQEEKRDKG
jgi:hypothetical protein